MSKILSPVLLLVFVLASCKDLFRFSPNEIRLEESEKNLNARNIEKIQALPSKSNFKVAIIGDSQRFYEELDDFVKHINQRNDISFVILNGDITDFGLSKEYQWVLRSLQKLHVPYVTVIGNHDMLANGRLVYKKMFGPENFSFTYSGTRFVLFNSSSREVGYNGTLPDLDWLKKEIESDPVNKILPISHVPPFSADFDQNLSEQYARLLEEHGINLSVHSHDHSFSMTEPYHDGVTYLVTSSMKARSYALVTENSEGYEVENVEF